MSRGMTLVELLIVITLLGLLASVTAFGLAGRSVPGADSRAALIARYRRTAIRTGGAVVATIAAADGNPETITFLPDGQILAKGHDPLGGGRP